MSKVSKENIHIEYVAYIRMLKIKARNKSLKSSLYPSHTERPHWSHSGLVS